MGDFSAATNNTGASSSASSFLGYGAINQIFSSAGSAYSSSQAQSSQGAFQNSLATTNAKIADFQAEDALKRGEVAVSSQKKAVKKLMGSQRVNAAAQGIDIYSGSAADITNDTSYLADLDALTIRNNAAREAFGYRVQGLNYGAQGQFAQLAANNQSNATLLTGGLNALGYGANAGFYFSGGKK